MCNMCRHVYTKIWTAFILRPHRHRPSWLIPCQQAAAAAAAGCRQAQLQSRLQIGRQTGHDWRARRQAGLQAGRINMYKYVQICIFMYKDVFFVSKFFCCHGNRNPKTGATATGAGTPKTGGVAVVMLVVCRFFIRCGLPTEGSRGFPTAGLTPSLCPERG